MASLELFNARNTLTHRLLCDRQEPPDGVSPATWHTLMECGASIAENMRSIPIHWAY
jgi:hypothetical protein